MCYECSVNWGGKLFVETECSFYPQDGPGRSEVFALMSLVFSSSLSPHLKVENYVRDVFGASCSCFCFSSNSMKNILIQEKALGSFTGNLVS